MSGHRLRLPFAFLRTILIVLTAPLSVFCSAAVGQTETHAGSVQCMQSWRPNTHSCCAGSSLNVINV